jgi:hypothetical protein
MQHALAQHEPYLCINQRSWGCIFFCSRPVRTGPQGTTRPMLLDCHCNCHAGALDPLLLALVAYLEHSLSKAMHA